MRKIFMFNMVSIDGFFAAPDGNIDWHVVDQEFDQFAVELNKNVDTALFGRTTYQLFESYWPKALKDSTTSPDDLKIAQLINDAKKIVFSRSLQNVTWNNAELHNDLDLEFIKSLKQQDGGDIVIWGSGTICSTLAKENLIDEYVVMFNPVILGQGKSLFKNVTQNIKLTRTDVKLFNSGNILATYKPAVPKQL